MKSRRLLTYSSCFFLISLFLFLVFGSLFISTGDGLGDISKRLCSPSSEYIFGCDLNGVGVLEAVLEGGKISLLIGVVTVLLSLSVGLLVGLLTGYIGGYFDFFVMRVIDILMAFPGILLALFMAAVLGPGIWNVILAISITGWISTAKLVRGEVLSQRERLYVQAAEALGNQRSRILFLHILPAIVPLLVIFASFNLASVIIVESSLSFLGLGVQQGYPTWGGLLAQGKQVLEEAPRLTLIPGFLIMGTVFSLNILGDVLRDIINPKK